MRIPLLCFVVMLMLCGPTWAKSYEIVSIDPTLDLITLKDHDSISTMRTRVDTRVMINGVVKSFKDLQPKLKVDVTLAEPGVAAALDATGLVADPIVAALTGTIWTWSVGVNPHGTLQFLADGKATYTTIHNHAWSWLWKASGPLKVDITTSSNEDIVLTFDQGLTRFTGVGGENPAGVSGHPVTAAKPQ